MNIEKERELFEAANPWASSMKFVGAKADEYGNYNIYLDSDTQIKFAGFRQGLAARAAKVPDIAEIMENAHMAGQADANVDPSFSNAQVYAIRMLNKEEG